MATAPAGRPQEVKRRTLTEIKAPEQFQFTKQGQFIAGRLISIDQVTIKGKPTMEYMFRQENGERITCLGTADLNKKITPDHLGRYGEIRYETDDKSFQKEGQSPMKVFKVAFDMTEKEPGF